MVLYFLHFPLPIVVGFLFWLNDRGHYWRFITALLVMALASFITYLFWPSMPPWIANQHEVHKVIDETIRKWGVAYYVSPAYTSLNPNRFAAFPSLHAAFPALAAIYAWNRYRLLAVGLVIYTLCVWLAIVYLGEHYFVDALAGLGYAALATIAVEYFSRRRRPAEPTRATPVS